MSRERYQQRLDSLAGAVDRLGELALERLRMALQALEADDSALAETVIEGDAEINRRYLDLEQDCIDLFALQQPVAGDLRFVTASFKISTDLERIADLATNLAAYQRAMRQEIFTEVDIVALGEAAATMVEDALAAYATEDVEACFAIADRDDGFDERCEEASTAVFRNIVSRKPDRKRVELLLHEVRRILLTIRDLERVGDHAVNIAARTLYMVENDDELIY